MRKVLISAYACEPGKGSEQGVGWRWLLEIAQHAEVWLITRKNNQESIEKELPPDLCTCIHFIYFDLPRPLRSFKRGQSGLYLYYALWQWGAYRCAKAIIRVQRFDFCQHLTFGSMWMPTFMHMLGIPFIWGPIGGGEAIPLQLIAYLPLKSRLAQYTRCLLIRFAMFNPFFNGPARAARAIIVRTEDSARVFPARYQNKVLVMLETGVDEHQLAVVGPLAVNGTKPGLTRKMTLETIGHKGHDLINDRRCLTDIGEMESIRSADSTLPLKLIYTGRLVSAKNVAMGIRACALACSKGYSLHLTIVGSGPLRSELASLAHSFNLTEQIEFVGSVTQKQVLALLKENDVFLFPSLKEGGTWSLIEAMVAGLPVICIEGSGMSVITDQECAFRIVPDKSELMDQSMADAIMALAKSADLRQRMGVHARKRIQENFLWRQKGEFMCDLFSRLEAKEYEASRQ